MARITSSQKSIFDRHLEAFKNDWKDVETLEVTTLGELRLALKTGKIIPAFFMECWERSVSITSQLYANMFDHVTDKAVQDCRNIFKSCLNKLEIV